MPAFASHYIFCEEMLGFLESNADFNFSKRAALIGTHGPDIFFFHKVLRPFRSKRKIGSTLHRLKLADIFDAFRDYCKLSPNADIAKSYVYGFILHYALDRKCHPYVYSLQERILAKNPKLHPASAHNRIESALDSYMISRRLDLPSIIDFDGAKTITSDAMIIDEISHLLDFTIHRLTTYSITEKQVAEAIHDTKICQRILRDKNGILRPIARFFEAILAPITKHYKISALIRPRDLEKAKKYANINNSLWVSPYSPDERRYESFEELFEIAQGEAKDLIKGFDQICLGCQNSYELTKNISFLTGVEVK